MLILKVLVMKNYFFYAAIVVLLCSCTSSEKEANGPISTTKKLADSQFQSNNVLINPNDKKHKSVTHNINHYVRGMMHQLIGNLKYVNTQTPIGVSSFVFLNSKLDETSLLGNQIAESFIHEVHQVGIPVIDFKTMDFIRVTDQGDFIFTRDFLELNAGVSIQYILTGTLSKYQSGYLVNARIIGLTSKAVVASAQGYIPDNIANSLTMDNGTDGINYNLFSNE